MHEIEKRNIIETTTIEEKKKEEEANKCLVIVSERGKKMIAFDQGNICLLAELSLFSYRINKSPGYLNRSLKILRNG